MRKIVDTIANIPVQWQKEITATTEVVDGMKKSHNRFKNHGMSSESAS